MDKIYIHNEKLKHARELRGWSQDELARRVCSLAEHMGHRGTVLDVSTISRWERGRNSPSPFYRQILCSLFDMNAKELGLLAADNLSQQNVKSFQESGTPESVFSEHTMPIVETHSWDTTEEIVPMSAPRATAVLSAPSPASVQQDIHTIEPSAPGSAPQSFFIRRRKLIEALLAGTTLAGGALFVGKLLLSPPVSTPSKIKFLLSPLVSTPSKIKSTVSRHWPTVVPDVHKQTVLAKVIQWMLVAHGSNVNVDGVFWTQTENALMLFQENANIPVTMAVTAPTWERLIMTSRAPNRQTTYRGSQVSALQEILNENGASPRLDVDGEFGPLTRTAVMHFQRVHHLPVTGNADLNTWCLLIGGYLK